MLFPHTLLAATAAMLAAGSARALAASGPAINDPNLKVSNFNATMTGAANSCYGITA